jgi:hypothetical protein
MSMNEREKLWMAYVDGEMTASEASAFDETLTSADRDRLSAEACIEAGLAQHLGAEVKCPDALWQRLQDQVGEQHTLPRRTGVPWQRMVLLAAAVALVAFGGFWYVNTTPSAPVVALHGVTPPDPEVFALKSATDADPAAVEAYMQDHGIQLALAESMHEGGATGRVRLVGSCQGNCPYGSIVEVLFLCGDKPARLLVTKVGSPGSHLISEALETGEVKATKRIGDYLAGLICQGEGMEVLDLLREPPLQIT